MSNRATFPFSWKPIAGAVDASIRDFRGDRDVRDWKPATNAEAYKFLGWVFIQVSSTYLTFVGGTFALAKTIEYLSK